MSIELYDYQIEAMNKMKSGSILCGGVGSGKSITALAYYYFTECKGGLKLNGKGSFKKMEESKDLYIITTAKKRDSLEWEKECAKFALSKDTVTIDSWNRIQKYKDVSDCFFIFDEQRVVGKGPWVNAFLAIAKKNHWVLLSATPGDTWKDYIPVFIANGFFKNKTEFYNNHCIFSPFSNYPKIDRYLNEKKLRTFRDSILVPMKDNRQTRRHDILINVDYNKVLYRTVFRDRWDPYEDEPIPETGKLFYLMRRVVNEEETRVTATLKIVTDHKRCIIFYNFNYELDMLRKMCYDNSITYAEWNGQKHEDLPNGDEWVYLVQYSAGCEGWNCITTDTVIFFSQSYSYRMTEQASGRIDRINTPYTDLYYYHLRSASPIDLAIHRALSKKKNFNEQSFLKRSKNSRQKHAL